MKWPALILASRIVLSIVSLIVVSHFAAAGHGFGLTDRGGAQIDSASTYYVDDNGPSDPSPHNPSVSDPDENGSAEHPFDAIQEAIDAASDGDTIIVRDGTYTGEGNRDIDFKGKAVHLRSENGPKGCIVACQATQEDWHQGFKFDGGEGPDSVLDGFTIMNAVGGAVSCDGHSQPLIMNCLIMDNKSSFRWASDGGGIVGGNDATILNNVIIGNTGYYHGGGIYRGGLVSGNVIVDNASHRYGGAGVAYAREVIGNIICNNKAAGRQGGGVLDCSIVADNIISGNSVGLGEDGYGTGGGISRCEMILNNVVTDNHAATAAGGVSTKGRVQNCIIVGNTAPAGVGGISCSEGAAIVNCIVWGNTGTVGPQVYGTGTGSISYSNIMGGQAGVSGVREWGEGNIDADPLFADPDNGDYHLRSQRGRWDPKADDGEGGWLYDDVTSPCIDAGDPASAFSKEPHPNGGRVNIGFYGNTPEASKTYAADLFSLAVESSPLSRLTVAGTKPGLTDYTVSCGDQEVVMLQLDSPLNVYVDDTRYKFDCWRVDGKRQPGGKTDVQIVMDADHTAEAVYRLFADVNGDCRIDVLDMIFVRNRLQGDVNTGDNWKADVIEDGLLNILDLIQVRLLLGKRCPE